MNVQEKPQRYQEKKQIEPTGIYLWVTCRFIGEILLVGVTQSTELLSPSKLHQVNNATSTNLQSTLATDATVKK